jgi:hypothetical protein
MKPTYEVIETPMGNTTINALFPDGRMLSIPTDPENPDYQAYLNKDKPQVEHLTEIVPANE